MSILVGWIIVVMILSELIHWKYHTATKQLTVQPPTRPAGLSSAQAPNTCWVQEAGVSLHHIYWKPYCKDSLLLQLLWFTRHGTYIHQLYYQNGSFVALKNWCGLYIAVVCSPEDLLCYVSSDVSPRIPMFQLIPIGVCTIWTLAFSNADFPHVQVTYANLLAAWFWVWLHLKHIYKMYNMSATILESANICSFFVHLCFKILQIY